MCFVYGENIFAKFSAKGAIYNFFIFKKTFYLYLCVKKTPNKPKKTTDLPFFREDLWARVELSYSRKQLNFAVGTVPWL